MKLSVVIVNYNVKYFLEHCLYSVRNAIKGIDAEVFIVDNNSVDGSMQMLRSKFSDFILIENKENVGFAKANNQAIRLAKGEYVLLLNPDTVVEEDTFSKCISFMDEHKDCGGLGIKMIDGSGKILKESKRGFPTPWASFCKMSGLTSLFPHSKRYAQYYMGHLSYDETNEVDILAGAYMMMRKDCLDKVGLLDEDFFMYGEDIDLSYRITQGGYKNYYFPDAQIIHYKGESTKKASLNYVYTFYNAMAIFASKHLDGRQTKLYSLIIKLAIWLRASLGFVSRIFSRLSLFVLDFILIYAGFFLLERTWALHYWGDINYYPPHYIFCAVPIYISILLFSVYVCGGYVRQLKLARLVSGVFGGMLLLLVFYSLLPAELRYSRALVVMGSVMSLFILLLVRFIRNFISNGSLSLKNTHSLRYAIVANKQEGERVADLLNKTEEKPEFIALVGVKDEQIDDNFVGNTSQIEDIIRIYSIDEVVFCSKDLSQTNIGELMSRLSSTNVRFTIVPPSAEFIIGSNTIKTPVDLYVLNVSSITSEDNRRKKRLLDIMVALCLLVFYIFVCWFVKQPFGLLKNIFLVIFGKKTWVGYSNENMDEINKLPHLKTSVLTIIDVFSSECLDKKSVNKLNLLYASNYSIRNDLNVICKSFSKLGQ